MSDLRRTVRCTRCNEVYDFSQVRYLPDGKRIACFVCLGIEKKQEAARRKREGQIFDYQCINCRYQFSRSALHKPRVCPECGGKRFIKFEKEKLTSRDLLKIADDPRLDQVDRARPGEFR